MTIKVDGGDGEAARQPGIASSPYATGGGGVLFAHRVAVIYLASMLTGERRPELGEHSATSLSFQTAPAHAVDDLLVTANTGKEILEVAIACRATPNFVRSDTKTIDLIRTVLEEIEAFDSPASQVVIATAGWKSQWKQVARLCEIARTHGTSEDFVRVLNQDGVWDKQTRSRLDHLRDMVANAISGGESTVPSPDFEKKTWRMLTRLRVVGFEVQQPKADEWTNVASSLDPVSSGTASGLVLRDELLSRSAEYDSIGAKSVTVHTVCRDLHGSIKPEIGRTAPAWAMLKEHRQDALASVRQSLGTEIGDRSSLTLSLSPLRRSLSEKAILAAEENRAVIVTGESGTGKSALTLSTVVALEDEPSNMLEAVILNMRELPQDSMSLQSALGVGFREVFGELTSPRRLLILDGADVAVERATGLLRDLLCAAHESSVGVIVVASDVSREFVTEQVVRLHSRTPDRFDVHPLTDEALSQVAEKFPSLGGVLRDVPNPSLLRRLVVLDLLVRTGRTLDQSMHEWECIDLIWRSIVRGDGRPVSGSAEGRDRTLILLAEAALKGTNPVASLDANAIDALRADHLLAPHSSFQAWPQFAHDEIRRYAAAMYLVRRQDLVETLKEITVPRWALSAVTLACKGILSDPSRPPAPVFPRIVRGFNSLAERSGVRWADVPLEAVLDTDSAYDCFRSVLGEEESGCELADAIRVVGQRFTVDRLVSPAADPVIRLLLDAPEPWLISSDANNLLSMWLWTHVFIGTPAGQELRIVLRDRLMDFWRRHPAPSIGKDAAGDPTIGLSEKKKVAKLDYRVTNAVFIEFLAMMGKDLNHDVESCLRTIAIHAPEFLAPAADSPFSARSLAQYRPDFLAELMESYYIENETGTGWYVRDERIREHDQRWVGMAPPYNAYYLGSFYTLFQTAKFDISVRVLNRILNHASIDSTRAASRIRRHDAKRGPHAEIHRVPSVLLDLDGRTREYNGTANAWSWYRGTSAGPNPCMSALQAMERVLDPVFQIDTAVAPAIRKLLQNCENLAVPGLIFGLLVRNIEHAGVSIDKFLSEPAVWHYEFSRCTNERIGFRASSEGLAHSGRREWSPREVCMHLVMTADEARRGSLRLVGETLRSNGERLGEENSLIETWAAFLEIERYRLQKDGEQNFLFVDAPADAMKVNAAYAARQERVSRILRIQNKYTARLHDNEYIPPSASEVSSDLGAIKEIIESSEGNDSFRPDTAVLLVARDCLLLAARGETEALSSNGAFAVRSVLEVASSVVEGPDESAEHGFYEFGPDRSAAQALPSLLGSGFESLLSDVGFSRAEVIEYGYAIATRGSYETRLFLARGCDTIWAAPCSGEPCIHVVALDWSLEACRGAVAGPWDEERQELNTSRLEGDPVGQLQQVPGDSIFVADLDATIRATGAAAVHEHCVTGEAKRIVVGLLGSQSRAMVDHERRRWAADERGSHTLIAARALLDGYSSDLDPGPVLSYLDTLRPNAGLISMFLHGLAGAGAENQKRADAAARLWPDLFEHSLAYAVPSESSPFADETWGSWAAAALLPQPLAWSARMYNELEGPPIDWVDPASLMPFIDRWISVSPADEMVVEALLEFIGRLPESRQVMQGLEWMSTTCIRAEGVVARDSRRLSDWLIGIRVAAFGTYSNGDLWQALVDSLVVAGSATLAPYSR
ncbi:hypothetical protein ACIQ00_10820 [Micrococcus luteus]|uniref:hypothetical protein n=1 Tax=Actinomycetes TaxID=1760 RepID=UPI00341EB94C